MDAITANSNGEQFNNIALIPLESMQEQISIYVDACCASNKSTVLEDYADLLKTIDIDDASDTVSLKNDNIKVWFPEYYDSPSSSNESDDDYFKSEESAKSLKVLDMLSEMKNGRKKLLNGIDPKYLDLPLLCMCRIYVQSDNIYKYIILFTRNLRSTLNSIDDTHACEWKIEIISLCNAVSQNDEVRVKYKLLEGGVDIDNNMYDISYTVYSQCILNAVYINPFYTIDTLNNETYIGEKINKSEHVESFE